MANLRNPNSLRNTVIVAMFKAGDNTFNLSLALQEFSQQVDMLMATTWRYVHEMKFNNSIYIFNLAPIFLIYKN